MRLIIFRRCVTRLHSPSLSFPVEAFRHVARTRSQLTVSINLQTHADTATPRRIAFVDSPPSNRSHSGRVSHSYTRKTEEKKGKKKTCWQSLATTNIQYFDGFSCGNDVFRQRKIILANEFPTRSHTAIEASIHTHTPGMKNDMFPVACFCSA